jgi:hypothetical protein
METEVEAATSESTVTVDDSPDDTQDSDSTHLTDDADELGGTVGNRSRALLEEFTACAAELKENSSQLLARVDDFVGVAATLDDIHAILSKTDVLVREEECVRCNRPQGKPHARMGCDAMARLAEVEARITQVYATPIGMKAPEDGDG